MTISIGVNIHFDPDDVGHHFTPGHQHGTLDIGGASVHLYLDDPAKIHAVIAHLVALENEMTADAPVITDSGRDCDQANPESGAWCHRSGDHGVHRDTDGKQWRTDTVGGLLLPADCDPDNAGSVLDERVPGHPVGLCGHSVAPGAWSQGYMVCRECLSDQTAAGRASYDRATAGEQLPEVTA